MKVLKDLYKPILNNFVDGMRGMSMQQSNEYLRNKLIHGPIIGSFQIYKDKKIKTLYTTEQAFNNKFIIPVLNSADAVGFSFNTDPRDIFASIGRIELIYTQKHFSVMGGPLYYVNVIDEIHMPDFLYNEILEKVQNVNTSNVR